MEGKDGNDRKGRFALQDFDFDCEPSRRMQRMQPSTLRPVSLTANTSMSLRTTAPSLARSMLR